MYDAIVVGARCSGSPTAMLLAGKGYKVLLLDKASFPSDTISTHIIWPRGCACLHRWGLLEKVAASGAPAVSSLRFDVGPFALSGELPPVDGVSDCLAPRRTVLDKLLLDAAAEAGAEVRENCAVEEVLFDGDKVSGVRIRTKTGTATENARVTIGADGRNSVIARAADAPKYNVRPNFACWYYAYWSVPSSEITFYPRPGRAIGAIPTNDGLLCVPVISPFSEFDQFRSDVEGNYMNALELVPDLRDRLMESKRETRFFGTADIPNFYRKPFGNGWALVGDAGYHKDPIGAQGISDAFRESEMLADALHKAFSGDVPPEDALQEYEEKRNADTMAMYEFNCQMATLEEPPPEMQQLFSALRGSRSDTERFMGTLAGSVPVPEFFAQGNIERIISAAN